MRIGNKKKTLHQIILLTLGICVILISSIEFNAYDNNPENLQENNVIIEASTLLISHTPIKIVGNAELEVFCAGNGTDGLSWETAFRIENLSIDSGIISGISLTGIDKFLIINNCSIENFNGYSPGTNGIYYEEAIEMINCSNVKISNCSFSNNRHGVYLESSSKNILIQNNCSYNDWGFSLVNSVNNTLFNNTVSHSSGFGFNLLGSSRNNITTNRVISSWIGISLNHNYDEFNSYNCQDNSIYNNTIVNNNHNGITITNSGSNTLLCNWIENNKGSGIMLSFSSENTFLNNTLVGNDNQGISLSDECDENLIQYNNFNGNTNGIIISYSLYNTITENAIINHNQGIGILIRYSEEYQSEQYISGNIFDNNMEDISFDQTSVSSGFVLPPYYLYAGIAVVIIGIVVIPIINGKIKKNRWEKFLGEREIENNELKSSNDIVENIDHEDPSLNLQAYNVILSVIGWISLLFLIFIIVIYSIDNHIFEEAPILLIDIPILILVSILNRKLIKNRWKKFITKSETKKSKLKIEKEKISNENFSKSSEKFERNKDHIFPKITRQDLYISFKLIGLICILCIMILFLIGDILDGFFFSLIDIPILLILMVLNRKTITNRWKKHISEREIKKNERKVERMKRKEKIELTSSNYIEKDIDQEDSKLFNKILKVFLWIILTILFIGLSIITYFTLDILVLIICIIYRKRIKNRWKQYVAEREIKKTERNVERLRRSKEKSLKSSRKVIKKMNKKGSNLRFHYLKKTLKFLFWSLAFFAIFLGMGASIAEQSQVYLVFEIPILIILSLSFINRKKIRYYYKDSISNLFIKIGQSRIEKAINYAIIHNYKGSRFNWLNSERILHRALRKIPDFNKIDFLEKKITLIKQNIIATYLSEGIYLSKIGWGEFQKNHFSKAKKQYTKGILVIEQVLKSLESQNVFKEEDVFPIKASLIFEILQFLKNNIVQIEIEEQNRKNSKNYMKSIDIKEINESIIESIKEVNESLWVYCQSLDSHEDLLNIDGLSKILENKLTKSEKILNSIQGQMQSIVAYIQTPIKKYEKNSVETNSVAMNTNRPFEQKNIQNNHLKVIREYEYIGGKIRLKVGIVNQSDNVITNLALRFDLPDSLKWIIHEPNLKRRGDTIHIARLGANEKIAISLYLEPINCLESMINATLTYFDTKDQPQAVIMAPKKVSISCPIFFTREEANIARVKKIQLELKYEDHKIFPLVKSDKSELIFNKILSSIGKHDVKLVQKEYSHDNNKGEAYFYGVTKVKKDKMIIRLLLDSSHQIIEISVNGDEQEPITGLLAELESEIRDKLLIHNIIEDSDKFHDINTSILLGNCPFCNGPISQTSITFFKKGETITCKYCDTALTPY